jgi:hypothetical protein
MQSILSSGCDKFGVRDATSTKLTPNGIFSGFTDKSKDLSFIDTDALRVVACLPCHKPPSIS